MSKYELTDETCRQYGRTLHRIRALRDIPRHGVQAGDLGGWVASESNLSQNGEAWIGGNARVGGNVRISGNVWIGSNVRISGNARIGGDARVYGNVRIGGDVRVGGGALIYGNARISDNAWIDDNVRVRGDARVGGDALIYGNARVGGYSQIYGNARVGGDAQISGNALIDSNACLLTATIFTSQALHATAFRQKDGSWHARVGCLPGSIPELRALAESDRWLETPPEDIEEARPELLAFVALCEARAARVARTAL